MSAPQCVFCGNAVSADQDYRKVVGFERRRHSGGTNALRLREPLDVWACRWCVDRESRGVSSKQRSLI